ARHAIPGESLGQGVLERRGFEAELTPRPVEHVARRADWIGSVRPRALRNLGEGQRMQPSRLSQRTRDSLDEVAQAHALEGGVVRLVLGVLAQVACERAGESDVFHPGETCLPLIGFGRY